MMHLFTRLLRVLRPETAHHVAVWLMRCAHSLFGRFVPFSPQKTKIPTFTVLESIPALKFPTRLGLAAGFDKNAEVFPTLSRLGFGFLEVGTVTPLPQQGNPRPRIWRVPKNSLVNALGFNNVGLERFRANLARLRPYCSVPVFANIGKGKDTPEEDALDDYALGFRNLSGLVDGFVVNVSSPNTVGLRNLQTTEFINKLAAILPRNVPTWVKFAPDLDDEQLKVLLSAVGESALQGVVLTNTSRSLAAVNFFEKGGLSGPPLLERALHMVTVARKVLGSKKTIIGVGGVTTPLDYERMREAGADLVEVYTGFVYHGPGWLKQMIRSANK